jgi:hypothetical protein
MIDKLFNFFIRLLLVLIGLSLMSFYIWLRFIRVRIPRDIPFEDFSLTVIIILTIVVLLFFIFTLIALYNLIHASSYRDYTVFLYNNFLRYVGKFFKERTTLIRFIAFIVKPLVVMEMSIKEHPTIGSYYKKLLLKIVNLFPLYEKKALDNFYRDMYFILFLVIKIILLTVFCTDIFYFHRLYFIYKVIPLGICILLMQYFLYALKYYVEKQTQFLESTVCAVNSEEWAKNAGYLEGEAEELNIADDCMESRRFIEEQVHCIYAYGKFYLFSAGPNISYRKECYEKFNESYDETGKRLNKIIAEEILPAAAVLHWFEVSKKKTLILKTKLIINFVYLICFSYLLATYLFAIFCSVYILL